MRQIDRLARFWIPVLYFATISLITALNLQDNHQTVVDPTTLVAGSEQEITPAKQSDLHESEEWLRAAKRPAIAPFGIVLVVFAGLLIACWFAGRAYESRERMRQHQMATEKATTVQAYEQNQERRLRKQATVPVPGVASR